MLEGTPLHRPSIAVDADWLPQIANDIAAHLGGAPPFIQQELSAGPCLLLSTNPAFTTVLFRLLSPCQYFSPPRCQRPWRRPWGSREMKKFLPERIHYPPLRYLRLFIEWSTQGHLGPSRQARHIQVRVPRRA